MGAAFRGSRRTRRLCDITIAQPRACGPPGGAEGGGSRSLRRGGEAGQGSALSGLPLPPVSPRPAAPPAAPRGKPAVQRPHAPGEARPCHSYDPPRPLRCGPRAGPGAAEGRAGAWGTAWCLPRPISCLPVTSARRSRREALRHRRHAGPGPPREGGSRPALRSEPPGAGAGGRSGRAEVWGGSRWGQELSLGPAAAGSGLPSQLELSPGKWPGTSAGGSSAAPASTFRGAGLRAVACALPLARIAGSWASS